MPERYVVTVGKTMHSKIAEESNRFDVHMKDYVQDALAFFVKRKINPATYDPGKEFDLIQIMKKGFEIIDHNMKEQERGVLLKMTEELVRGRLLQEGTIGLLIEKLVEVEKREEVLKDILSFVEEKIKSRDVYKNYSTE